LSEKRNEDGNQENDTEKEQQGKSAAQGQEVGSNQAAGCERVPENQRLEQRVTFGDSGIGLGGLQIVRVWSQVVVKITRTEKRNEMATKNTKKAKNTKSLKKAKKLEATKPLATMVEYYKK
jgi:hypothetical protein